MYIYCKNCKKHTEYTHPKILVLISNEKAKVKSQCAECLADRTFFDQINNKYDLEQLVKHFFLLMYFIKDMKTHCVKCRKNAEKLNSKTFKTKNGRLIMQSKCNDCGIKKSRSVKEQEAKGLVSIVGIKTPLSKISLLNVLL